MSNTHRLNALCLFSHMFGYKSVSRVKVQEKWFYFHLHTHTHILCPILTQYLTVRWQGIQTWMSSDGVIDYILHLRLQEMVHFEGLVLLQHVYSYFVFICLRFEIYFFSQVQWKWTFCWHWFWKTKKLFEPFSVVLSFMKIWIEVGLYEVEMSPKYEIGSRQLSALP